MGILEHQREKELFPRKPFWPVMDTFPCRRRTGSLGLTGFCLAAPPRISRPRGILRACHTPDIRALRGVPTGKEAGTSLTFTLPRILHCSSRMLKNSEIL